MHLMFVATGRKRQEEEERLRKEEHERKKKEKAERQKQQKILLKQKAEEERRARALERLVISKQSLGGGQSSRSTFPLSPFGLFDVLSMVNTML